jgi:hypothetical protein
MNEPLIFVKPAVFPVKCPDGTMLATDGEWKPHDVFWAIRLLHKDVVEATPPGTAPEVEPQPEAAPVLPFVAKTGRKARE